MLAALVFLTPRAALVALAALLPLAALAFAWRRQARVRALLGLQPPPRASRVPLVLALCAVPALLGVAAAQPALRSQDEQRVRTDAQAVFAIDVSRSMQARSPAGKTRLARAKEAAVRLRAALPDVPSGVATLTDRVLPDLLPVAERRSFDDTVQRAVLSEQPPPESGGVEATTLDALGALGTQNYFPPEVRKRVAIVLTDGESRPFDAAATARALGGVRPFFVHVSRSDEQVYGPDGNPEPGYHADPASGAALAELAAAADGAAFGESSLDAAAAAVRAALGSGPTTKRGTTEHTRTLAPWVALLALVPLGALLAGRRLFSV